MNLNTRQIAAGSLAAVALLVAGPIAGAGARGGGGGGGGGGNRVRPLQPQQPVQPQQPALQPIPQVQPPQPQQLPPNGQLGQVRQVKLLRLAFSCRASLGLAHGALEYETFATGASLLTLEVDNAPPLTPMSFVVDGITKANVTTDILGNARWTSVNDPLVPTITTSFQVIDAAGVVAGTSC